ncbi:hypothetical protein ACJ41O_007029 [Fusarium nematophilum]
MAAKNTAPAMSSFPGIPREDDATANLLSPSDREEGEPPVPSFSITISPVQVFRFCVFVLSITDTVFICMSEWYEGWAAFFAIWTIILCIWSAYNLIACLFRGRSKFDIKLGNLFFSCGRLSDNHLSSWKKRSYIKSLVDFVFCCLFIIPSVLAFKTNIWQYELGGIVGAITITVASLQLTIAVLGIFSLGRKVQIALFKAEESKPMYTISELYRDEMSEPRQSMASEASEV